MATFASVLKSLRESRQLSQQDLATVLGMSKSSINMYERGEREPSFVRLEAIADFFNVDMDYLLGKSQVKNAFPASGSDSVPPNILPMPAMKQLPLLGAIACGEPILAEENLEGYINVPEGVHADFCLRCAGDSMTGARILDGDIVFVQQCPDVENGAIAAVLIDDEATLKRIYKSPGKLVLQPENPRYEPLVYVGDELESLRILGRAVAFLSNVE